jgi:Dockerin type I domain/PEP-CTERM motif
MIRQNIDGKGLPGRHAIWRGAAAAVVVLCASGLAHAAGLTYVDAYDDSPFSAGPQNIFASSGAALSTVLDNSATTAGDGKWGFLAAGAGGTVEESNTENNQELRMHAAVPNGNYDVYVAYWSGNVQEGIRAGVASSPGANPQFSRAAPAVQASAAAWLSNAVKPLDNTNSITDDNGVTATTRPANATGGATGNWTVNADPFYDHTPNGGDAARFMYLAQVNPAITPIMAAGGTGLDIFVDDIPSGSPNDTTRFDGLVYVAAGTPVFMTATIDRTTGDLKINNPTTQGLTGANGVITYTVSSTTGSLNSSVWNTITHNTAGVTQAGWAITAPVTPPDPPTAPSVTALTEAGTAATFAATTGQLDLGNVWRKSPIQDISVTMQLADGSTVRIDPTYTGTTYAVGDFNTDGAVNATDFALMMTNLHASQTGQTISQTYAKGDFNQNGAIDRNDFIAFRSAFCAVNSCTGAGGGAWGAMVAGTSVPEPSTWLLLATAGGLLVLFRRQSRLTFQNLYQGLATMMQGRKLATKFAAVAAATLTVLSAASSVQAQVTPVTGWLRNPVVQTTDTVNVFNGGTNSPTFGTGAADSNNNIQYYGSTANVHIDAGEEISLTGKMRVNRDLTNIPGTTIPSGDVRFGAWKKANTNAANGPGGGWLGYMAFIASGTGLGDLEVRNPDTQDFRNVIWVSNQGGASITSVAGPAPVCNAGMTCDPNPLTTDGVNVNFLANTGGAGTGRYFRLAQSTSNNQRNFQYNQTYSFTFHVGRYGTGDSEVSATVTQDTLYGDYNNDGTVNAADYTVWRDHLGQPGATLQNRDPATDAANPTVVQADYNIWRTGFGGQKYTWNIGGGTDFDGLFTPAANGGNPTFTSHVTFDFDRVGLLFGGGTHSTSADMTNVQFGKDVIQTLSLNVNTTTGVAKIANSLATPLTIDYYEISSAKGDLVKASWLGIDGTAASAPDGTGWDAAGGSDNTFLAEGNLSASLTLGSGVSTGSLGAIFNPATLATNRDLRFFIGLSNGSVIRGNVNYGPALGGGASVPEPGTMVMLLIGGAALAIGRRRYAR